MMLQLRPYQHWYPSRVSKRRLKPLEDRGPLRVLFVITSMPVGGAETLLVELVRGMDRQRFQPELCCLKRLEPLGEMLAREVPTFTGLLRHKYDLRVLPRLVRLCRQRRVDAVVTVGTGGDKMFWGRLAAWLAGVPVICSALHSTGLPDHVERLNRLLTPMTDAFIAVADPHAQYLAEHEGCPRCRVHVVPNGVDTQRFVPQTPSAALRAEVGLPPVGPAVGIVAALRPEKDHELFLQAMAQVVQAEPTTHALVIGDGPRRGALQSMAAGLGLEGSVHFLGTRRDIPQLLAVLDAVVLTSKMEANPVCVLEALACGKPVVVPRVGSLAETVSDGLTGYLVPPGDAQASARAILELLRDPLRAEAMGQLGRRQVVAGWSLAHMVAGYERLLTELYTARQMRYDRTRSHVVISREPEAASPRH